MSFTRTSTRWREDLPSREDDLPGAVEDASHVTANHNSIREI
jgi:hypothetical protein